MTAPDMRLWYNRIMKKYFSHRLEHLVEVSRVITIHHFEFDKNFRTRGESHDFWELVYADREEILCSADGKEIRLCPGEMLFHKPLEFHTLSANGKKAPTVLIVSFVCKSDAMRFLEGRKLRPSSSDVCFLYAIIDVAKRTFDIPYSDPETKKMELLSAPTLGGQQLIKNYLEILLINILRSILETTEESGTVPSALQAENTLVREIKTVLAEHLYEKLTVDEICRRISYGRAHAFREFKKGTGMSIMAYFNRMKMEKAKQLLREREMSVSAIADALSFDSPGYFSKAFKKYSGQTPLAYQKMNMKL